MPASAAQAVVDATRLFLARHEEALASGEPRRGIEACEGLLEALESTLPTEVGAVPASTERHAIARVTLERRISELEGLALQLKLGFHQLETRNVDVLRLVALLTATRRQIRALQIALELWAAEHGATVPQEPPAFEALRAARESLVAGCASAAREALVVALGRAGKDVPSAVRDARDLLGAWHALDEAEALLRKLPG